MLEACARLRSLLFSSVGFSLRRRNAAALSPVRGSFAIALFAFQVAQAFLPVPQAATCVAAKNEETKERDVGFLGLGDRRRVSTLAQALRFSG